MALKIYKISEFDHIAETKQFDSIVAFLDKKYKGSTQDCALIGNYNIEGVELDALLITDEGIRILEFKNWGGRIIARENGPWTSCGMIVEGGAGKKTPYEQIRLNRSRVTKGLKNLCEIAPKYISAAIIFWQDCDIDTNQLSNTVKNWLHIFDNKHITCILDNLQTGQAIYSVGDIISKLRIEEFNIENKTVNTVINEIYEPEASSDFFESLENALALIPNYRKVYNAFNQVFQQCINQNTSNNRLNLGGTFAKTDYLLKEYHASKEVIKCTNDTRVRLRKRLELLDEDLKKWCYYDVRNLAQFVAFIYNVQIPKNLRIVFPTAREEKFLPELLDDCLRLIVNKWDEDYVYCMAEASENKSEVKVCYSKNMLSPDYDWKYLNLLFYSGAQLNIIRPREENGILFPEHIIFEPDYLVDISTIARCFTNYAESPFVNLIKKLEPSQNTKAIVLGNFAGQLLDEQIHQMPNTHSYLDSVTNFWHDNAISLLSAEIDKDFHEDAQKQRINIAKAIGATLPESVGSFNPKECMVEPSFFSEMLGLQGRMDFLQLDYKLLLEQKSGKGEFPYGNFTIPKHKEEHYVQMLLYMMLIRYNFKEIYERNGKKLAAFLLYSKYSESLLGLSWAPELMHRAIKVRNGLAWTEFIYTQPNGFRILESLTPEKLNKKHTDDSLWTKFQYRQIADVLSPIQNASELERSYYFRFLTFVANEHLMSKLGNKTKGNSGFASKWYDSLEEKLQAGNIYDNLTLVSPASTSEGNIKSVRLRFSEKETNDMSNFRVGDIVILYSYEKDKEPDARKTMVFRCTIESIETDTINLKLRATQSDSKIFLRDAGKPWAIEHDFMESSYSSLYKGIHSFLSAPQTRKDLILLQRTPEVDSTKELNGNYGDFNDLMIRVKRAKDLFLIIGPPGTGKTSFGLLNTLKEELSDDNSNVLLLSYTNRAVDEICSKLSEANIAFIRLGVESSCSPEYHDNLLLSKAQTCKKLSELKQMISSTRVFVATTTSMNSNLALLKLKTFSLAIIDEASQILEPHLLGILSAHNNGAPSIKKMVFIGDHKQLPAVVQQKEDISKVLDINLKDINLTDCRFSLFERLLKAYREDNNVVYMLKKQGRMHHDIAVFPNYTFYNNMLTEVPLSHQNNSLPKSGKSSNGIDNLLLTRRIAFINADSPTDSVSDKVNQVEADIIAFTVLRIYQIEKNSFDIARTIGIIVPYRNQIATVRNTIEKCGIKELHDITIDTVERYQGSQRKYIIYGFTIQKYYQLNFLTNNVFEDWDGSIIDRKLNVAMTRAEEHLIIVGNAELLSNNFTFFKLIQFIKSRHGFFKVSRDNYIVGNFNVPECETEELDLSKATFSTSKNFDSAFEEYVLRPIKLSDQTIWPDKIFGYDMATNLNLIGYGRINFSNQLTMFDKMEMSPKKQVLLYCYYIMRQHYCSSKNLYTTYHDLISLEIQAVNGRLHFIDIGCGPATCGIAFSEIFLKEVPNMVYTGIDISAEMKIMGKQLIEKIFDGKLYFRTLESFNSLTTEFWQGCSEIPSLIFINISYFFSNITPQFAERLASQIVDVMQLYPLNKYILFIQHSEVDKNIHSFKVFKRILNPYINKIQDEEDNFTYVLNYKERTLNFCYNIYSSK